MNDLISAETLNKIHLKISMNVKIQRQNKRVTQLSLALAMGHKTAGLVAFAEAGINNKHFNIEHLATIAKILDISILELFDGVDKILNKND